MDSWEERFSQFVERKEADARGAAIAGFKTERDTSDDTLDAIGTEWTRRMFDGAFYLSRIHSADLPAANLVFVQSRDGNTGAADPSSLGGGETDKHLIYEGLSRVAADAVLAGGNTVRGGHLVFSVWHPELVRLRESLGRPRHPIQIVATLRGIDVDDGMIFNVPDMRVILLTSPSYVDAMHHALTPRPWITPIIMDDPTDLRAAFRRLGGLGINRISCVGGRTVARQLIDARLVQDLYLTTSPKDGGEPNTPLLSKPISKSLIVRKHGTGGDTGALFEHFQLS